MATIMYFYSMTYAEVLELSLPTMQILMEEMSNVHKTFSPTGSGGGRRSMREMDAFGMMK